MKYKITDADSYHIKVEYEDGSYANIATAKDMTARAYAIAISQFRPNDGVSTDDLPVKVGDEGTVGEILNDPYGGKSIITYDQARSECYPTYADQLEAAFKAREGDDTMLKGVDNNIKLTKAKFPKTEDTMTWDQYSAARKALMEDASWYSEEE